MRHLTPSLSCPLLQLSMIFWFPGFKGRQKGKKINAILNAVPLLPFASITEDFLVSWFPSRQKERAKISGIVEATFITDLFRFCLQAKKKMIAILDAVTLLPFASIINDFLVFWFPRQAKEKKDKCDT